MGLLKRIIKLRKWLVGSKSEFSLFTRIFHVLILIAVVVMAYNVPFNFAMQLPVIALVTLLMVFAFSYLYYLSRFKITPV